MKRAIAIASPTPTSDPMRRPSKAKRNEYQAPLATTRQIWRLELRLSGSNNRVNICHTCGIALRLVFGRMRHPNTSPPAAGPSAL